MRNDEETKEVLDLRTFMEKGPRVIINRYCLKHVARRGTDK